MTISPYHTVWRMENIGGYYREEREKNSEGYPGAVHAQTPKRVETHSVRMCRLRPYGGPGEKIAKGDQVRIRADIWEEGLAVLRTELPTYIPDDTVTGTE
ncbi:hypothetical protein TWF569_007674 [Orbilia oligospora]|uniref:Uncharacterized protein n=1 Tax=Orbilia oligospora TaxID=2813651 RepID=A0A7C8J467_ORBOL|nr:hypothetical protein TWF102_010425 [Orbilia oligospora]KAF3093415.1 hypothetical protein TWF103_010957 [Orbilia oligospora]KAF3107801.1 hypothetical protein TWF706_002614 [Orbilia oligospora]KAF3137852.1 hypothetical protein TWF594_007493 [Orbilia oligospora]KAF3141895.1 hypothetical protein TWF569_007674 [Orbilia oligospora]